MRLITTSWKALGLTGLAVAATGLLALGVGSNLKEWADLTPVAAQVAAPWTAVGASGSVDESSIPIFGFTNASAGYGLNASTAPLDAEADRRSSR